MTNVTLKDLCVGEEIGKYGIPASAEEFAPNKVRYLRISDIDDYGNLLNNDKKSVSSADLNKYLLKEGDIVFARTGNSTGRAYYHENKNGTLAFAGFLIKYGLDNKKLNPKYLRYFTISNEYKQWVKNLSVGSTRGNINAQTFADCPIILPDRNQQDNLVKVLSTFDDKIELNNGINAELEAMAKTLYDYWFVQFDFPDENGKPYKSSGGKMTYSEVLKREIPEGWEVKKLEEFIQIKKGSLITEKTANTNGEIKVISAGIDFSYRHDQSNFPENTVTISASGANAGFVNFWREPIFACDCTTVRSEILEETLYALAFLKLHQEHIYSQAKGSAQPHVYPKDIGVLNIIIPPNTLLSNYGNIVIPANKKIAINEKQNQQLAELRDWLLPMMMNGQVRVE